MKVLCLWFVSILFCGPLCAQFNSETELDSALLLIPTSSLDTNKVNLLQKIASTIYKSKPEEALVYLREAKKLASDLHFQKGSADVCMSMGVAHRVLANFDSALYYLQTALVLYQRFEDQRSTARTLGTIGLVESSMGDYSEALEHLETSIAMSEQQKDTVAIGKTMVNIALNYYHLKDYDRALNLYEKALVIQRKLGNENSVANIAMNTGLIYFDRGDADEAIRRYRIALEIYERLNNRSAAAICYNNIANALIATQSYLPALANYQKAKQISLEVKDKSSLSSIYSGLGEAYSTLLRVTDRSEFPDSLQDLKTLLANARANYLASLAIKMEIGDQNGLQFLYLKLSELAEFSGDAENALRYLKTHIAIKDSLFTMESARKIAFLESKRERDILDRKIEIQELEIEKQHRAELGYTLSILAVVAFSVISFFLFRARREVKLQKFRNSIASDLHDEIGSTLSAISISSAVIQHKMSDNQPEVKRMVQQIGERTDSIMDSMSDIVWTINANNDHFENVINRMRALALEILEPLGCRVNFNIASDLNDVNLDMQMRKNLYLIFKEALNNISKYAQCNAVSIDFARQSRTTMLLRITDNGVGFDLQNALNDSSNLGGNGLKNMISRAQAMNAKLNTSSSFGNGTCIELFFRV